MYVDDTVVFLTDAGDLDREIHWITTYRATSGARINWDKSFGLKVGGFLLGTQGSRKAPSKGLL
ncbi:hypothetical protein GB937_010565 [Aspergillus fischeri]|nr:hypothetical protein GB937_010565 [Aspergillus fischeri]